MATQRESYDKEFKGKTVEHSSINQYEADAVKADAQVFVDYDRLKKLEQDSRDLQEGK